jgi:hypothetical protein
MLQAGRSPIRVPDEVDFFNLPNYSRRIMALGSTQPVTELSTRNIPGGKKRPAYRADNLTAICEPHVWKIWEPQPLATLRASTACTGITLPLPLFYTKSEASKFDAQRGFSSGFTTGWKHKRQYRDWEPHDHNVLTVQDSKALLTVRSFWVYLYNS